MQSHKIHVSKFNIICFLTLSIFVFKPAKAQEKINFNFMNEEIINIIQTYSKASKQKFVIDPNVRGKASIILPEPVPFSEAFDHLSSALALNGYSISNQNDTMVISSARNIQRDFIEVSTKRPALKPQRMMTWIYKPKFLSVEKIVRELRIISSRDGEITSNINTNQIIMTDWVTNINRVASILEELDKPIDKSTLTIVENAKAERIKIEKENERKKDKENVHSNRIPQATPAANTTSEIINGSDTNN